MCDTKDSNEFIWHRRIVWLLALLFFGGFITNAFYSSAVNIGQVAFDLSLIWVVSLAMCHLRRTRSLMLFFINLMCAIFVFGCVALLFLTQGTLREAFLGFRNNVIYLLAGVIVANSAVGFDLRRIVRCISFFAIIICFFAIMQFVFRNSFPEQLMTLKGEQAFGFADTDIVRVNGLLGSTLGFSGLCVFLFAVIASSVFMAAKSSFVDVVAIALIACANLLTFSRASIAAMLVIVVCFVGIKVKKCMIRALLAVGVIACCVLLFIDASELNDSFLMRRLTSVEETTQGSDDLHREMLENGLQAWRENKLFGVGIGTQGHSSNAETCIVADGYWVATLLELGLPVFVALCVVYALAVAYLIRVIRYSESESVGRILSLGLLLTIGYFFVCSLINSTFSARHNFCLFWLLWGCDVAGFETEQTNMNAV